MGFSFGSMMGGGGGGGAGGGGGGMDMGGMMNAAGKRNQAIMSAIEEPYAMRRERVTALAPMGLEVGQGIQPVSRYPGGSAMVGAMARERAVNGGTYLIDRESALDRKIRNTNAAGKVAHNSAAIVRAIAMMIAGGAAAGAAGGGGGGGGVAEAGAGGGVGAGAPAASAVPEAGTGLGMGAGAPVGSGYGGGGFSLARAAQGAGRRWLNSSPSDDNDPYLRGPYG